MRIVLNIKLEVWFHYFVVFNFNFINPCTRNIYQTFYEENDIFSTWTFNVNASLKCQYIKVNKVGFPAKKCKKFLLYFAKFFVKFRMFCENEWSEKKNSKTLRNFTTKIPRKPRVVAATFIYTIILCTESSVLKVLRYHNQ